MKKILYTGGAGGIARGVIEKIYDKYFIYVGVHSNKQLELVSNRYKGCKNIKVIKLDLMDDNDIEKVKYLDIDIFISNAALSYGGSILEMDIDKIREIYEVNVFRNFMLAQIVLRNMINRGSGKVIMMSSLIGLVSLKFLGGYSSSKASINKLTQTLKKELKLLNKNIHIHLIEPGMYKTGFNQVMLENKYKDMSIETYFKYQIESIRKKENLFWNLFEKKKLNSIVNEIVKCIESDGNKFIYSAPKSVRVMAKLYSLFND